jgi:hypothetical protein
MFQINSNHLYHLSFGSGPSTSPLSQRQVLRLSLFRRARRSCGCRSQRSDSNRQLCTWARWRAWNGDTRQDASDAISMQFRCNVWKKKVLKVQKCPAMLWKCPVIFRHFFHHCHMFRHFNRIFFASFFCVQALQCFKIGLSAGSLLCHGQRMHFLAYTIINLLYIYTYQLYIYMYTIVYYLYIHILLYIHTIFIYIIPVIYIYHIHQLLVPFINYLEI